MCLSKVLKLVPNLNYETVDEEKVLIGYKNFILNKGSLIGTYILHTYDENKWLKVKGIELLQDHEGNIYNMGFHSWLDLETAKSHKDYLSLWDKGVVLRKILIKDIITFGINDFFDQTGNCVVSYQIKILDKNL